MRNIIRQIVDSLLPFDALEQEHCDQTLAWIDSGAPLCRVAKPNMPPQHLVSYFVLYDPREQQLLLVDHRKAGLWLPSGGHVEPGEHPATTVIREAQEELQIEADFLFPQPIFLTITRTVGAGAAHSDVSLWYVLRADRRQKIVYDHREFKQIAWFALDRLPLKRSDPHMARFVAKLQGLHTL